MTVAGVRTRNRARGRAGIRLFYAALVAALALPGGAAASTLSHFGSGVLIIGDNDADAITMSSDGTTVTIRDTGPGGITSMSATCPQVNATTVTCPAEVPLDGRFRSFTVDLRDGIDSFVNQNIVTEFGSVRAEQPGGNASGAKTIVGGPGTQSLRGGTSADSISGGEGDDQLNDGADDDQPTGGNDALVGGPGVDGVRYFRDSTVPLSITLDGAANDGQAGEADNVQVEHVFGNNGNDVLVGDAGPNELVGAGGNDQISGMAGEDDLFGDIDSGRIERRGLPFTAGDDILDGGLDRDDYDCGTGFDTALHEPLDQIGVNCERTGAEVVGDSAQLRGKKKNKFKAELFCPDSEVEPCTGKLKVTASGKKIGKGKFSLAAGATKGARAKLSKKGMKAVRRAGGALLATVEAQTSEPGGTTTDRGTILVHR